MAEKKGFFKEFKEFITKGNVLDMAIGVIIGGAFNAIVTTLNQKVLMPVVNWALSYLGAGTELVTVLPNSVVYDPTIHEGAEVTVVNGISYVELNLINWSALIEATINFVFIALTLFVILKVARYASRKRQELAAKFKKEEKTEE